MTIIKAESLVEVKQANISLVVLDFISIRKNRYLLLELSLAQLRASLFLSIVGENPLPRPTSTSGPHIFLKK